MMTGAELALKCRDIAKNYKSLYIKGCFGAPMNDRNKYRYSHNNAYNKKRANMINGATPDTFGFDCIGLVKGVLWGWSGNVNKTYGGAVYKSNNVPDVGEAGMLKLCTDVSSKWDFVEVGEFLYMSGHCGVYIGEGLAVECTPKWENKVQVTCVANIGKKQGYNSRKWTKHGKMPFVDYGEHNENDVVEFERYIVKAGDNLTKIAKKYKTTVDKLVDLNKLANPNVIRTGQVLKIGVKL